MLTTEDAAQLPNVSPRIQKKDLAAGKEKKEEEEEEDEAMVAAVELALRS